MADSLWRFVTVDFNIASSILRPATIYTEPTPELRRMERPRWLNDLNRKQN
jgi:hypothetical protein